MCPGSPTTSLKSFDEISSLLLKRVGKPEILGPDCKFALIHTGKYVFSSFL